MKKFKLSKEGSIRFIALTLSAITLLSVFTGCNKKGETEKEDTKLVQMMDDVEALKKQLQILLPGLNQDIIDNATLILMLDELKNENKNGKISAEYISTFKNKIDPDNMMNDFNSFIDALEQYMIDNEEAVPTSNIVREEDKDIISKLEKITNNTINGSKEEQLEMIDLIVKLFVDEDEIMYDGLTFSIKELNYADRAVAGAYARMCAYYSRNYISKENYDSIDARTNDQNNKSYIMIDLNVLANQVDEKSEIEVSKVFEEKYNNTIYNFSGKVNTKDETVKDLVNYLNSEYLDSDKVANSDKDIILGEYSEEDITNTLTSVDAITKYNQENPNDIILLSNLLINEYKETNTGKFDEITLNFIQYNVYMFLKTTNENSTEYEIYNNVYFKNLNEYKCNRTFTHETETGKVSVNYQDVSDGVKLICDEMIRYALSLRTNLYNLEGYEAKVSSNLEASIRYIITVLTGECGKVEINEYVK